MHRQLRLLLRSVPAEAFVAVLDDPVHELLDSVLESGCPLMRRHLLKRLYIGSLLRQVVQVRVDEVVDVKRIGLGLLLASQDVLERRFPI